MILNWKIRLLQPVLFLSSFTGCTTSSSQPPLFSYDGKEYSRDDLAPSSRQKIFSLQNNHYQEVANIIREDLITIYFADLAKEKKTTPEKIRESYYKAPELSEDEKKKFYEDNKNKIPYSYEMIKGEIDSYINESHKEQVEVKILGEIETRKKARILMERPAPVKADIEIDGYAARGSPNAKIVLVEYGDFACPHCRETAEPLKKLLAKYGDRINYVFKYFLLYPESISDTLAKGAQCALNQNRFWDYHDLVFKKQMEMIFKPASAIAKELSLNEDAFKLCYDNPSTKSMVTKSHEEAARYGVKRTPTFYLNGKQLLSNDVPSIEREINDLL